MTRRQQGITRRGALHLALGGLAGVAGGSAEATRRAGPALPARRRRFRHDGRRSRWTPSRTDRGRGRLRRRLRRNPRDRSARQPDAAGRSGLPAQSRRLSRQARPGADRNVDNGRDDAPRNLGRLRRHHPADVARLRRRREARDVAERSARSRLCESGSIKPGSALSTERVEFARPGMSVTLNSLARGLAADRVAAALARPGIAHRVLRRRRAWAQSARRADGEPWLARVRHPAPARGEPRRRARSKAVSRLQATTNISGRADYSRNHIVDPRRGASPRNFASVCVSPRAASSPTRCRLPPSCSSPTRRCGFFRLTAPKRFWSTRPEGS